MSEAELKIVIERLEEKILILSFLSSDKALYESEGIQYALDVIREFERK